VVGIQCRILTHALEQVQCFQATQKVTKTLIMLYPLLTERLISFFLIDWINPTCQVSYSNNIYIYIYLIVIIKATNLA